MPVSPEKSLRYIERLRVVHGLKKRTPENIKKTQISRTNSAINSGLN